VKKVILSYRGRQAVKDRHIKLMRAYLKEVKPRFHVPFFSYNFRTDETHLTIGIPDWLDEVLKTIIEKMPLKKSRMFPLKFLETMRVGVDLKQIKTPFFKHVLKESRATSTPIVFFYTDAVIAARKRLILKARAKEAAAYKEFCHKNSLLCSLIFGNVKIRNWAETVQAVRAETDAAWDARLEAKLVTRAAEVKAVHSYNATAYTRFADKLLELLRECK